MKSRSFNNVNWDNKEFDAGKFQNITRRYKSIPDIKEMID